MRRITRITRFARRNWRKFKRLFGWRPPQPAEPQVKPDWADPSYSYMRYMQHHGRFGIRDLPHGRLTPKGQSVPTGRLVPPYPPAPLNSAAVEINPAVLAQSRRNAAILKRVDYAAVRKDLDRIAAAKRELSR